MFIGITSLLRFSVPMIVVPLLLTGEELGRLVFGVVVKVLEAQVVINTLKLNSTAIRKVEG